MQTLSCFKAYDIRGRLGEELNEDIAYRIGRAFGAYLSPKVVVIGGDMRLSSAALKQATANGLLDSGVDVIDLGMTGTEEVYFATKHLIVDGGIEITASHNPIDYNGMKLVRAESKPISGDTGLNDIRTLAESNKFPPITNRGQLTSLNNLAPYVEHVLTYITPANFRPLKLVVNAGNGAAGHVIDALEQQFDQLGLPVELIKIHHQADGTFPNGIPNPLLIENRQATAQAVITHGADMGIAWDGDFDRCFLFDEQGQFIEGYYIVGLLAEAFLAKDPGQKIIHDPRMTWNTIDLVNQAGGTAVVCKTGHAFIKERMRSEDAVYGGEMSAHHYFRDFAYCDSGMIPWLLVAEMLCVNNTKLSAMVAQRIEKFPSSGEINRRLIDPVAAIERVKQHFSAGAIAIEHIDGLSIEHPQWRFNLRSSNTEPVVRLNVESRGDVELLQRQTAAILALLNE
ncbi:MAG: phosphomannomutase CpsG [Gammaproteobacteria bacterium]|nr:phosphomannomutase CpsG [Gammaproteobacteria bacterium]